MRPPRFANPARRRFPFETLSTAAVARIAFAPSSRGPRVTDLHDPATFRPPDPASPADAAGFAGWGAKDLVVRGGVVEGMSLSGRAFISAGAGLFRLTPLRDVRLVAVQPFMGELARCPHLAHLRRLDLSGARIGAAGVRELAASAYLGGLRELDLAGNDLGREGVAAVRAAPWFGNLESLGLADNGLAAGDLDALLAGGCGTLTELDLSGNDLGGGLGSRGGAPVRRLRLSHCGLGAGGVAALLRAVDPAAVEALDLGFNDLEDAGAAALAAAGMASLVALELAGNRLTAAGAAALAGAESFGAVEALDLSTNPIGDGGVAALVRGRAFAGVTRLGLANCGVTDAGVAHLVAGAVGGWRSLALAWNPVGDAGVTALAACPSLAGLVELDLTGTRFGFAGAVALADSPHLAGLRALALGDNPRLPPDAAALLRGRFGRIGPVAD